ncbi:MAG: hypothetical protein ACE5EO_11310 [Candidatus Krumholzibacteriia bacterium]
MSKANHIRKKALDFAKKRQWDQALQQYIRLAEIESQNPNVFNELGDLHLKMGNKGEAFAAFHSAIDAYSRVSLFNNAVAVCKKIIRLNPTDHYVFGKLARLRNRQGFKQDAAKYAMNFLDLVCEDERINPDDLKEQVTQMGEEIHHAPDVLERIAEYLTKWEFKEEAAAVLARLAAAYTSAGMENKSKETKARLAGLGAAGEAAAAASEASAPDEPAREDPAPKVAPQGAALSGLENHRVDLDPSVVRTAGAPTPDSETSSPAGAPAAVAEPDAGPNTATRTATEEVEEPSPPAPSGPPPAGPDVTEVIDARPAEPRPSPPPPAAADAPESGDPDPRPQGGGENAAAGLAEDEVWVPQEELPDELRKGDGEAPGEVVNVADIVSQFDAKVKADVDMEDYRSHYDLGMAYLEMDLLPEAIREFQFASNSSLYQVRCLEMIGLCFLKQNQARLAIKQLEKGLDLVDEGDRDSLGLQYNLGLAYEMTGDEEKARMCFEDVYVVDVTFRDVSEKIKKYTS